MKRITMGIAAMAALAGTSSQAAAQSCITSAEMNGLVTYFLPQVVEKVIETCSAHVPADSYLRTRLGARADELRQNADTVWPLARAAFLKIGGAKESNDAQMMSELPDEALRPLIDIGFVETMGIKLKPDACGEVNDIGEALAPLNTAQTVHLIAVTLAAAARGDKSMASCPRDGAEQG